MKSASSRPSQRVRPPAGPMTGSARAGTQPAMAVLSKAGAPAVRQHPSVLWVPLSRGRLIERFFSGRVTGLASRIGIDVAALQQIIQAAHTVPAVSVSFEHEPVLAAVVGLAVVFRQQVDQKLAGVSGKAGSKRDLPRF